MDTDERQIVWVVVGPYKELIAVCSAQSEAKKIEKLYQASIVPMVVRD